MDSIRILAKPPGEAPEYIRKAWVGVVIPLSEEPSLGHQTGVLGGKATNIDGYIVNTTDAIEALRKTSPIAAEWWDQNLSQNMVHLVFAKSVCQLVTKKK
jgi:hypothetical protein